MFPKKFKVERIGENTEIKEDVPVLLAEVGIYEPVVNHLSDITFNDLEEESISDDDDDEPTFENIDDLDI